MKALLALAALFLLLTLGAALWSTFDAPRFDPVQYARLEAEAARVERLAAIDDALTPLDLVLSAAWRLLPLAVILGLLALIGAWAVAGLIRFLRERRPDERGLLPIELAELPSVGAAALGAYHTARIAEAQQQPVPHSLNFSPHYNRADAGRALDTPVAQLLPPGDLPSFRALLDAGRVGPGRPMLLGLDRATGEPVEGSWLDLYSCAVGGLSGTGKSWTATFLLAQAALQGSRLLLLDPHADSPESLTSRLAPMRSRFVCEPADTPAAMLAAVKLATGELERRKAGGYTRGSAPIVVVADEFAALQRGELADPLAALLEALAQEGRKLDLYGMVCSQVWSSERAGGTPLRDSLAAAYVHRLRPAQARMMTGLTSADLPDDLFTLPAGVCYLVTTGGELRPVVIPQMAPDDLARVAEMLGGAPTSPAPSPAPSPARRFGFRPPVAEGASEGASEGAATVPLRPHQEAPNLTAEEAAIVAAFLGGKSPSDLAVELSGGAKGGEKYQQAARRVAEVLRRALARRGAANA